MTRVRPRAPGRPPILARRLKGRRLGDPVDLPAASGARAVRGRLAAVSVRASLVAGAWVGAVIGLVVGAILGAVVVWFSGAVIDWQRDLAFTFGVTRRLLPFGDQLGLLRDIQTRWWLVIIGTSLGVAFIASLFGTLLGGILAAAYNRSPRHALVVVELPSHVAAPPMAAPAPIAATPQEAAPVIGPAVGTASSSVQATTGSPTAPATAPEPKGVPEDSRSPRRPGRTRSLPSRSP